MRYVRLILGLLVCMSLFVDAPAHAIETVSSQEVTVKTDGPWMITAYSTTAYRLNYVQIYNASSGVAALDGWTLFYAVNGVEYELPVVLQGSVRPQSSVVVADAVSVPTALFQYDAPEVEAGVNVRVNGLRLAAAEDSAYLDHSVTASYPSGSAVDETYYMSRNRSTSTGNYLTSFTTNTTPPNQLVQDALYMRPADTALRIVEVLANPRSCSPLELAGDCRDYVKLYNPTDAPIELAEYRLRVGYSGQGATSSNTLQLGGTLVPGAFASYEIGVTNSGGWVWLEDMYGAAQYDATVVEYVDASAESKKGYSWALGSEGWNWATPRPSAANLLLSSEDAAAVTSGLVPCTTGQYRNPETNRCNNIKTTQTLTPCRADQYRSTETNRCRNIASTGSTLTPCDADEYRSPDTNRCRKLIANTSSLVPCKAGQYRSEETNRCRSLTTASASLKPCAADQERNPETNRCRKKLSGDGDVGFAVVDTPTGKDEFASWLALGGLGVVSLGYAGWEWRREMWGGIGKVFALLPWIK